MVPRVVCCHARLLYCSDYYTSLPLSYCHVIFVILCINLRKNNLPTAVVFVLLLKIVLGFLVPCRFINCRESIINHLYISNDNSLCSFEQINSPGQELDIELMPPITTLSVDEPDEMKLEEDHEGHGFHFLSDEALQQKSTQEYINDIMDNFPKTRSDLLDYLVQPDKTVVCKWCGEWLPSRTHWYRHKYKRHMPNAGLPAGLIKCAKCNTFFKSKRGYVGHCITRHGSVEEAEKDEVDENVIVKEDKEMDSSWLEIVTEKQDTNDEPVVKMEPEQQAYEEQLKIAEVNEVDEKEVEETQVEEKVPEKIVIEKEEDKKNDKVMENSGRSRRRFQTREERLEDYAKQREKEEKMVADIIAKVKKECEDQSITMCRRGYTRRSTVMTSFKAYDKRKFSTSRFPVPKS